MVACEIKIQSGGFKTKYTGLFESTSQAASDAVSRYMIEGKAFSLHVEAKKSEE